MHSPGGKIVGSISLAAPVEVANPLLVTLTREVGRQIEDRLRTEARPEDLALAMSFMRFTNSGRPTVVMDQETLLANTPGLTYVSASSQVILWEMLIAHDWSAAGTARLELGDTGVQVVARRIADGNQVHFIVHFVEPSDVQTEARPKERSPTADPVVEGVLLVEGPRGSGRATAALALHGQRRANTPIETYIVRRGTQTPWTEIAAHLDAGTDVLLRRVEEMAGDDARRLNDVVAGSSPLPHCSP